ncbi:hypothetical protein MSG28_008247 [Choristoneura fumiferana]|uniref:Uncharacterized protein n=1 Tax=Choristoneura fumiferana TaxID=7141 RepID=A0ACC0JAL9_CHOFU|nr:hypothetical protein MSG28_008247 [Choristoneura fumiferana]
MSGKSMLCLFFLAGKHNVGHPEARWTDDLKRAAGGGWMRGAENRVLWRAMEEAYVQQWAAETSTKELEQAQRRKKRRPAGHQNPQTSPSYPQYDEASVNGSQRWLVIGLVLTVFQVQPELVANTGGNLRKNNPRMKCIQLVSYKHGPGQRWHVWGRAPALLASSKAAFPPEMERNMFFIHQ